MAGVFPRRFGKYVLLKPMARGGMGEIYLAAAGEGGFQKFCVIKKVIAEKTDPAKANRFLDEAKVVLRLSHANLVPTFDAGEIEGEFYIAMDLIEGKDLREIWNRCVRTQTRIPLDVALHIGREIARALAYVHSYGDLNLVHRDVAPPNILVSYFGEVKLTDFGLARSVLKQEHTAPGVVFGRASYLAPEQARGEVADARTDVYSLGIVLWELLTGNQYLQLANLDPATAMSLVRHPRPQAPSVKAPWITKDLDQLLLKALAPAREDRFQTSEEMRQALSDVMAKLAPRADAERAAAFVRSLYENTIKEERDERDKLLADATTTPPSAAITPAPGPAITPPPPVRSEMRTTQPLTPLAVTPLPTSPPAAPPVTAPATVPRNGSGQAIPFPTEEDAMSVEFVGRVIDGRYKVVRKLGEGGMGTVYAAEHVEIGKLVAMKILHLAYSNQQDLVERFRREARAASKIGHPNIIDVTDFGSTEEGCAYFVMEHLDGIDLADVLSHERRLEAQRACQIAIQICRALAAAHAAGVIHRDLKPENIFLVARDGKADFVKVLDFGIARSAGRPRRLTNPGVAMGTPEYMAPEQAKGGVVDQRSDIYSVGALLYEMVTGSPPQHRGGELVDPKLLRTDIADEIDRVIIRSLESDPSRRYQSMAQLEYDIVKALFGRPRAVSELLGLRVGRRRTEASPGNGALAGATGTPAQGLMTLAAGAEPPAVGLTAGGVPAFAGAAGPITPVGVPIVVAPPTLVAPPAGSGAAAVPAAIGGTVASAPLGDALIEGMADGPATPPPVLVGEAGSPEITPPPVRRPTPSYGNGRVRQPRDTGRHAPEPGWGQDGSLLASGEGVTMRVDRTGGGRRFLGTFALLALVAAAAVPLYRKLPWSVRQSLPFGRGAGESATAATTPAPAVGEPGAPAPPSDAELRARRIRGVTQQIEKSLAGDFGFAQLPALQAALERLRGDSAEAEADAFAARARAILVKVADAELERGEIEGGVAHYKQAVAIDPNHGENPGLAPLREQLKTKAMAALVEQKDPSAAVRWSRALVALGPDEPGAHALLADMLYAAGEYSDSAAEYKVALVGQPGDIALLRGLKRAAKKAGTAPPADVRALGAAKAKPRAGRKAKAAGAGDEGATDEAASPAAAAAEGDTPAPPSAPEPAADQE